MANNGQDEAFAFLVEMFPDDCVERLRHWLGLADGNRAAAIWLILDNPPQQADDNIGFQDMQPEVLNVCPMPTGDTSNSVANNEADISSSYIAPVDTMPTSTGDAFRTRYLYINMMLFKAVQLTFIPFSIIYKKLTKICSGQTVRDYFTCVLDYNDNQIKLAFSRDEWDSLDNSSWDPFQQNIPIIYRLLQRSCGLGPPVDDMWTVNDMWRGRREQSDTIEYHLDLVKNIINQIVQLEHLDIIDENYAYTVISSIKNSLSSALRHTELIATRDAKDFLFNLENILKLQLPVDIQDINHMKLIMAVQPKSPTTNAIALIYTKLTKVSLGQTVRDYCTSVLGYNARQFKSFTMAEWNILDNPSWDPFQQNMPILYKLLQRVCGLAPPVDANYTTPSDTIEYYLYLVNNIRNKIVLQENLDIIDANYVSTIITSLQTSLSKALLHTELISRRSTSKEANDLIVDLDNILAQIIPVHSPFNMDATDSTTHDTLPAITTALPSITTMNAPTITVDADTAVTLPVLSTLAAADPVTVAMPDAGNLTPPVTGDVVTVSAPSTSVAADSATVQMTAVNSATPVTNNPATTTSVSGRCSSNIIDLHDINTLKLFMAVRPGSPTATALAVIYKELTKITSGQTVEDYYKSVHKKFNKEFSKHEKDILSNPSWDPFIQDVSFLYKLLQNVCGLAISSDSEWTKSGTLEYHLKDIKEKRNCLSHETTTLTPQDLRKKINELKKSFKIVFERVSSITSHSITTDLNNLTDGLDNILSKAISLQNWDDCRKVLAEARKKRALLVFKHAQEELKVHYQYHLKSASPIFWLSDHFSKDCMIINNVFTDLEILKDRVPVILEKLLSLGRVVVIQGQAGVGKTTVVKYMAGKWHYNTDNFSNLSAAPVTETDSMTHPIPGGINLEIPELRNTDVLLVMQCRYIYSENLIQYLKEDILKYSLGDVDKEEVIPILNKAHITIMVDGWDEAKQNVQIVVYEALQKLSGAQFLFTTRPEFTKDLDADISNHSEITQIEHVRIVGFSAKSRWEFVKKVFTSLKKLQQYQHSADEEQFLKFIEEKEDVLGDMTFIPLTLAFLIILWNDDSKSLSSVTSTTDLFIKLLDMMTKKLAERLRKRGSNSSPYHLRMQCKYWLKVELGHAAWTALSLKETCLPNSSMEKLGNFCIENKLEILEMFSTFLISDNSSVCAEDYETYVWSFIHKSVQEYCAASYLHHQIIQVGNEDIISLFFKDQSSLSLSNLKVEDSEALLYFLCGLLSHNKEMIPERAQQIIEVSKVLSDGYNIVGRLILESQENPMILKYIRNINFTIDEVKSSDIYLVKCLLKYTSSTLNEHVNIYVKKVTSQLKDFIQYCSLNISGIKPRLRLKCTEDLTKMAQDLQKIENEVGTECKTRLMLATSHNPEYFIGGNSCSVHDIFSATPNLANVIDSNTQASDLPDYISQLREYIGKVSTESADIPKVRWLLQNTRCQLHPGTGRSICELLELVDGLEHLIVAGDPSKPLQRHIREMWCTIDEVLHKDIPDARWLMRHTRCRLFTWSRKPPMRGAHVQVHQGACGLAQLVEPHFQSNYRGIPLEFEFSSLDVVLTEGTSLVKHLYDVIPFQNGEELIITMEVEFLTPTKSENGRKFN